MCAIDDDSNRKYSKEEEKEKQSEEEKIAQSSKLMCIYSFISMCANALAFHFSFTFFVCDLRDHFL